MPSLLIKNIDWLVTVDAQRRAITDGAVLIQDDRIKAVGKTAELASSPVDAVIDGKGTLAMPGLIDTSVSLIHQLGRGLGDLCEIPHYRLQRLAPYEAALSREDAALAARACALEMARGGTTCFVDTGSRFPDAVATAAGEIGLRGVVSRACQDIYETSMGVSPASVQRDTTVEAIDKANAALDTLRRRGEGRVKAGFAIPWLLGCSDALLKAVAERALASGATIVVSAAPTRDDAVACRIQYRKTEVQRLKDAGLLGPHTIVSHAGWTSPEDLKLLVDSGATIACCPSASHRLGTGALENGRFAELLAFGANVTLGSGSAMGSNFIDIARQLYLFCGGHKTFRIDATVTPPEMAIEMATIRAAKALGMDKEIGSLEAGKQADITMFRCTSVDWVPLILPLQNLAFSSRGGADTVLVAGKAVVRGGRLATGDEAEIMAETQARAEAVCERAGLSRYREPAWPVL